MSSGRYEKMFARIRTEGRGAFIPFVVVGDPDLETSVEIMRTLAESGADALELGIPFSDPVADGPTIQVAVVRALENGATPDGCLLAIARIREAFPELPIGILTYANAIVSNGMNSWFQKVATAGVDSVLAADIPVFEGDEYVAAAAEAGVDPVFIAPPNADEATMKRIAALSRGYTYVVARKGVTGVDKELRTAFFDTISRLSVLNAPPPVVGFGISSPDHVRAVLLAGAQGAISGSAVVSIVEEHLGNPDAMKNSLARFVNRMKAATQGTCS